MSIIELYNSKLFKGLNYNELTRLLRDVKTEIIAFGKKDTLWNEGDCVDGIGLLNSGRLFCQRHSSDGKIRLVRILAPGDLINNEAGVSLKRTSPVSVVGASEGSYIWFENKALLGNPKIPRSLLDIVLLNLLSHLSDDAIRLMKNSDIMACRTVRERLFLFLDTLRENQGNVVVTGMTHSELAQHLFVDRTSLSEELNKMRREGLIDYTKTTFELKYHAHNIT